MSQEKLSPNVEKEFEISDEKIQEKEKSVESKTDVSFSSIIKKIKDDLSIETFKEEEGKITYLSYFKNELEGCRSSRTSEKIITDKSKEESKEEFKKDWQGFVNKAVNLKEIVPDYKIDVSEEEKQEIIKCYNNLSESIDKSIKAKPQLKPPIKWLDYFEFGSNIKQLFNQKQLNTEIYQSLIIRELHRYLNTKDNPRHFADGIKLLNLVKKIMPERFNNIKEKPYRQINDNLKQMKQEKDWFGYIKLLSDTKLTFIENDEFRLTINDIEDILEQINESLDTGIGKHEVLETFNKLKSIRYFNLPNLIPRA